MRLNPAGWEVHPRSTSNEFPSRVIIGYSNMADYSSVANNQET